MHPLSARCCAVTSHYFSDLELSCRPMVVEKCLKADGKSNCFECPLYEVISSTNY